MVRVTFLYPNKPGNRLDADSYVNLHIPLVIKRLG
jgi:hypothetical protein